MRLIDADALIRERVENDPVVIAARCAPTVYNVDKVVEQLEKEKEQSYYYSTLKGGRANRKSIVYGKNLAYQRAIEIVKAGGID